MMICCTNGRSVANCLMSARLVSHASWRHHTLAAIAALLVGFLLGYLGWILPIAGASLLNPTLIVFGIGLDVAVVGLVASSGSNVVRLWHCPSG